jgi:hypothetical protein
VFVQVIQGQVSDPAALRAALDRWLQELAPGATGWLDSTSGVTEDGRFIAVVRFESAEAAKRNSYRVGCQFAVPRFRASNGPAAEGRRPVCAGRTGRRHTPIPGQEQGVVNSSSAAVFVDQPAQHVDSFHRRLADARPDEHQPGGRTGWLQIQASVWPYGVVVA